MRQEGNLIVHDISQGTPEWHAFRENGIGGSEVGVLCADNKETYKCQAQLFYEKLGLFESGFTGNEKTFWGQIHESNVALVWQYWDWATNSYCENFNAGNVMRRCFRRNGYAQNVKYPWLFASLDRMIKNGSYDYSGAVLPNGGILEIKTMGKWMKQKWESVPTPHLFQVHQYMLIFGKEYAEIAVLVDGSEFMVYPVEFNEYTAEDLLDRSYKFWHKRIEPCKVLVEELKHLKANKGSKEQQEKILAEIARYEPEVENTKAYADFINQRYEKEIDSTPAPIGYIEFARVDKVARELKKKVEEFARGHGNALRKHHEELKAERIELEEDGYDLGYTRMYVKKGQKNPTLDNKCTADVSEAALNKIITNIGDNIADAWAEGSLFLT